MCGRVTTEWEGQRKAERVRVRWEGQSRVGGQSKVRGAE
jgi:hypothetical protein